MRPACACDDSLAAREELAKVKAERDYLLTFADPKEIAQMRRELAAEWAARQGHLPEAEQSDFDEAIG